MKKVYFLFFLLFCFFVNQASAYSFKYGGVCYNITSSTDYTVSVTYAGYTRSGSYSDGYTYSYYSGLSGSVTIPSTVTYSGVTYTVTGIGDHAFRDSNGSTITSITLPNTIKTIGMTSFNGCSKLTSIIIPEGVQTIDYGAFGRCTGLKDITIPSSVTSINSSAFYGCTGIETLTVNGIIMPSLSESTNLTTVNIGKNYTGSLTALCGKTSLTNINIDSENTAYTASDGIIYNKAKTSLLLCLASNSSVNIPSSVTSIGDYAFSGCKNLTQITLPSSITTIGNSAFSGCCDISGISLPSSVSTIGTYAFSNCSSLETITIPKNITAISEGMFSSCTQLKEINYAYKYGVKSIGSYAFSGCKSLKTFTLPEHVTEIGTYAFRECSSLECVGVNTYGPLKTIGNYAFYLCTSMKLFEIPINVTTIGNYAFSGCTGLQHIIIHWYTYDTTSYPIVAISSSTFSDETYNTATVHATWSSTVTTLKSTSYWNKFSNIDYFRQAGSINLNEGSAVVTTEVPLNLTATIYCYSTTKASVQDVIWTSSDESIATVSSEGTVTGLKPGKVTITATTIDGSNLSASCDVTVKYANALYMNDLTSLAGSKPEFPVYMDNSKEICNLQFDVVMPEGIDIYYGENDDEEEVYWVTKGDRAKTSHTVSVKKQSSDTYRILISSTSNVNFKDTDKSLPIANIKLDINKDQAVGSYDIKLKNIMLTNYSDGVTTPISVVDTVAKIIVPPSYTIAVTPSTGGSVKVTGDSYDESVQQTTYGSSITMTATPDTGYHFVNWSENKEALSTDNPYTLSNVSADHTIMANFAANTYRVTFVVDGNTYSEGQQTYGQKLTLPTAPTKTGYTFTGWEGVTSTTTVPANDVTYNAVFTINQYTVKFIADGNVVYEEKQDYQSTITAPDAPVKDGYAFVTWGDVLDVVPANDVTYTAEYVLIGDVYEDSEINVADLTSLVGIILSGSENLTKHVMKEADVYSDDKVNVADYTNLVALILGSGSNAKAMNMINTDYNETTLNGTFVENNDGNTSSIILNLANAKDVTAYQFDIDIPNGYQFADKNVIMKKNLSNHTVMTKLQEDGSLRVVVCSNTNAVISTDNQLVLNLVSKDNGSFGEITTIKNIVCATSNHGFDLEDSYVIMNATDATSINNAKAEGTLNIKVVNHNVYLTSSVDKNVCIYSTDGTIMNSIKMIASKQEVVTLPSGVYVVNSKKFIIK